MLNDFQSTDNISFRSFKIRITPTSCIKTKFSELNLKMELFEHLETKVENEDCKKCTFTANSTESLNEHIRDNHVFANFTGYSQTLFDCYLLWFCKS